MGSYRGTSSSPRKVRVAKVLHPKSSPKKVGRVKALASVERHSKINPTPFSSDTTKLHISVNYEQRSSVRQMIASSSTNLSLCKESARIRRSMKEYEAFAKSQRKTIPELDVSCVDLKSQLRKLSGKITSLMRREIVIRDLLPCESYDVEMKAGSRKQYRIEARMKPIPLRMRIEVGSGLGGAQIFLSQGILRPTLSNCDKAIILSLKEINTTYANHREKIFTHENIYMTIEATKDISFTFQCVFGRDDFKTKVRTRNEVLHPVVQIKSAKTQEVAREQEVSTPETPIKMTRRVLQVARNVASVKRIRPANHKARRKQAEQMKELIDREDMQRKLILMNKQVISRRYDNVVQKILKERALEKMQLCSWVELIKGFKTALKCYRKYEVSFLDAVVELEEA